MKNTIELQDDINGIAIAFDENDFGGSKLMLTGSTGLIGSLILRAISRYNEIHQKPIKCLALARNEEKIKSIFPNRLYGVDFLIGDITNNIITNFTADYIIHTACPTTSHFLISNPVESIESICCGTINVLRYAKNCDAKSTVFLSSMEAFGQFYECEHTLKENELGYIDLSNVRSCYPESKRLCELLCKSYSTEYGLNTMSVRLGQVFGAGVLPNENRVFAQFARSAVKGEDIILHTSGESIGNYCYTTDAIRALLKILRFGTSGETYTAVNEDSTMMIKEMAQLVVDNFSYGRSKIVFDIPKDNKYGYADTTKMRLSSTKLRELGWIPEVGLIETYRRMIPSLAGD